MAEYIKLENAIREIEQINPVDYGAMWDYEAHHWAGECLRGCKEAIDSILPADVVSVVHGRWEWLGPNRLVTDCMCGTCSACKIRSKYIVNTMLCPNCGAIMDGGADHAST